MLVRPKPEQPDRFLRPWYCVRCATALLLTCILTFQRLCLPPWANWKILWRSWRRLTNKCICNNPRVNLWKSSASSKMPLQKYVLWLVNTDNLNAYHFHSASLVSCNYSFRICDLHPEEKFKWCCSMCKVLCITSSIDTQISAACVSHTFQSVMHPLCVCV